MSSKRPFEVNTRAVFAFMGIGCGLSAITDWSTMMDMPNYLNKTVYQKHKPKLSKNYDGSANSMQQECAKRIWQRSISNFQQRYTTMLSDGDSKSYDSLVDCQMYGDATSINKEESLLLLGIIWRIFLKIIYVGRKTVEIITNLVLCQFSKGFTFCENLCQFTGMDPGQHMVIGSLDKSMERIRKASSKLKLHQKCQSKKRKRL